MIQCQRCHARATLFLCTNCTNELREMLTGLARGQRLPSGHVAAGWLENLQDVVLKRTRTGESVRRSTDRTGPLMVHLESSRLLDNVHAVLVRWVQDICDSRGVNYPGPRMFPRDFIGPLPLGAVRGHATGATRSAAVWLAKNVSAIACDESAGMCYAEIKQVIDEIERMINRAIPLRYCGPCPTINGDDEQCLVGLFAKPDDVEVVCWKCRYTHNVERLIQAAFASRAELLYDQGEILEIMSSIGEPIPPRTWRHWRATGKIQPRNELGDVPRYWLADVRKLRNQRTELAG